MDPTSTPSPKSPLEGWGLSWGGWLDNRHGEWWLLAQLALIAAHLLPPWPAPGSWGYAWPLPLDVASMVWIQPLRTSSDRTGLATGPVDWATDYAVQIRVRYTPDTQAPDEAIDGLIGDAYAALAGYSSSGVQDVVPGTEIIWDYADAELNVVGAQINCTVIHRTQSSTLTAW